MSSIKPVVSSRSYNSSWWWEDQTFHLSHPSLNGCSHYRKIHPIQRFTILFPGAYLSISNHPDSTAKVLLFSVDFQEETAMATFPKFHTKAAQKRWRIDASPLPQTRRSANSRCSPPVVEKHRFTPHEWFHLLFQEGRYMYLNKNIYNIISIYFFKIKNWPAPFS